MLQWAPAGLIRTERASPAMAGRMCLATLATAKSPIFSSQEMQIACFKAIFSQAEPNNGRLWQKCLKKSARNIPGEWLDKVFACHIQLYHGLNFE